MYKLNTCYCLTQRKGDNLIQKQEQEDLQSACDVMEDLIRMQNSIFTVSYLICHTCSSDFEEVCNWDSPEFILCGN